MSGKKDQIPRTVGIFLIAIGFIMILLASGLQLPSLSFVSVGPVTIGDISSHQAIMLGGGIILMLIGIALLSTGSNRAIRNLLRMD